MRMRQIAVCIAPEILFRVDKIAEISGRTRADIFRQALADLVLREADDATKDVIWVLEVELMDFLPFKDARDLLEKTGWTVDQALKAVEIEIKRQNGEG